MNDMTHDLRPGVKPPSSPGRSLWFLFQGGDMLVDARPGRGLVPLVQDPAELGLAILRAHYLGARSGVHCFAGEIAAGSALPVGLEKTGLRGLFGRMEDDLFWIAARAVQIVDWDRTHQFCGRCGTPTRLKETERARECPACGLANFPRLAPAVIVAIERGDEILLERSHRLPPGMYSVVAGFVEPGETLEEAAVREIREEVGLEVSNLRYFASQPWPFPHSLMIAFTAQYAGGEICIEPEEIEAAGWFRFDNMPPIPGPLSVARRLIDNYLRKHNAGG
jgi:NAD+ diphosphatase